MLGFGHLRVGYAYVEADGSRGLSLECSIWLRLLQRKKQMRKLGIDWVSKDCEAEEGWEESKSAHVGFDLVS